MRLFSLICGLVAVSSPLALARNCGKPSTTTSTTTSTTSTSVGTPLATFNLVGRSSTNVNVNNKLIATYGDSNGVWIGSTNDYWTTSTLYLEAGTQRLMTGSYYIGYYSNSVLYTVTLSSLNAYPMAYVSCPGGAFSGVPLQCFAEGNTAISGFYLQNGVDGDAAINMADPTVGENGYSPIDLIPQAVGN